MRRIVGKILKLLYILFLFFVSLHSIVLFIIVLLFASIVLFYVARRSCRHKIRGSPERESVLSILIDYGLLLFGILFIGFAFPPLLLYFSLLVAIIIALFLLIEGARRAWDVLDLFFVHVFVLCVLVSFAIPLLFFGDIFALALGIVGRMRTNLDDVEKAYYALLLANIMAGLFGVSILVVMIHILKKALSSFFEDYESGKFGGNTCEKS